MSTNIKSYTDRELLDRMSKLDTFKGFPEGYFDIWIRSSEDEFDVFDDKVYTFLGYGDNKLPKFIMVTSGTTNAGAEGLKNFEKYNRLGCAVLKSDHMVYDYAVKRKHKGEYWAYCQDKIWPHYRDNNKDTKADEKGTLYKDIIGANCHAAGQASTQIGGWSCACLVRNIHADFDKWMNLLKAQTYVTVCILKEF